MKIGGDKGGGSFKMSFQLGSTEKPNPVENTCVFSIFNASDTPTNLHIALARYQDQISNLTTLQWRCGYTDNCYTVTIIYILLAFVYRGKRFRIFFVGDYELLCSIYGISGASGVVRVRLFIIKSNTFAIPFR